MKIMHTYVCLLISLNGRQAGRVRYSEFSVSRIAGSGNLISIISYPSRMILSLSTSPLHFSWTIVSASVILILWCVSFPSLLFKSVTPSRTSAIASDPSKQWAAVNTYRLEENILFCFSGSYYLSYFEHCYEVHTY